MPPKVEKNVVKYLKDRETGQKTKLCPDTQDKLRMKEFQREYDARRRQTDYQEPQPEAGLRILGELKKGGMIKKTGVYKLHKGEMVVPVKNVEKVKKALKPKKK